MHPPEVWETDIREVPFKLAAGKQVSDAFEITLRQEAHSGEHRLRVDFDITANRRHQFSLYRRLNVGLGEVTIDMSTSMDENGNLVVDQLLTNLSDSFVSFDCLLFAPDRRRQRVQVLNLGPGQNTHRYVLPRGQELVGKSIWLRAEEIGGDRMLNQPIIVE